MNFSEENMGQAFKEALEGLEIKPSESVWDSVNTANLKSGVTKPFAQFSHLLYGVAATVVFISSIYLFYSSNNKSTKEVNVVKNNVDNVVAPNIQKDTSIAKQAVIEKNVDKENIDDKNKQVFTNNIKESSSPSTKKKQIVNCGNQPVISEKDAFASVDSMVNEIVVEEDNPDYKEESYSEQKNNNAQGIADIHIEVNSELNDTEEIITNSNVDTFNVKYSDNPVICFGEDALLIAEEGYYYQWNTGSHDNHISVSPVENSYYEVTVTNKLGQTNSHTFTVSIDKECSALYLPSAFTPNGDGKNDVFKAEGIGIANLDIIVYNAIGQRLFEATNINQSWDGRFKGEMMPAATYFYQASYVDAKSKGHIKRGQITLIR